MYSMRSPIGVSVWYAHHTPMSTINQLTPVPPRTLSGLALRQCIELGFHRKMPWSRIEPNALKSQMRRRVFWCSYNIDRAVSITLGRPVGIHDADIDVDFPLDLNDEAMTLTGPLSEPRSSNQQPATTISAAIHTIRVRQIWGRIQNVMYPQVVTSDMGPDVRAMLLRGFRAELRGWLEGAPEQLQSNREANNAFGSHEWFEIMYHHSILMLYRQSLTAAQEGEAFLECARAGERICQLYRHLHMRNQLKDTWGALHVLFLGSVTFLYCLWSSPETRSRYRLDEVAAICSCTMVILAVMAERYEVVRPYRDTFETLAGATQTMLVEAQTSSEPQVLPVLPTSSEHLSSDLADMAEFGMCSSIEVLLSTMIQ